MFFGIGTLAIFLSVLGTQFYKNRFEKEEKEISHAQRLILDRMNNLEKNQEQLQKQLKNLIDELKNKIN
jgi:chaperonin cofactor prefoldin